MKQRISFLAWIQAGNIDLDKNVWLIQYDVFQVSSLYASSDSDVTCNICLKKFCRDIPSWSQKFRRHMLAHTGSKPYKCFLCDYHSSRKDSVKRHARLKHFSQSILAEDLPLLPHGVVQVIEDDFQNIIPKRPTFTVVPEDTQILSRATPVFPVESHSINLADF